MRYYHRHRRREAFGPFMTSSCAGGQQSLAKPYRGEFVRHVRTFIAVGLSAALLAASASSADARWGRSGLFGHGGFHGRGGYYGHGGFYGGRPGLVGGAVIGALALATLPLALAAGSGGPPPPPPDYYGRGYGGEAYGYGPPAGPASQGYDQRYGPPPQQGYRQQYGPPQQQGYNEQYGPSAQQGYNRQYGPPPGYGGQYGPPLGYYDGN
jgi:hypothetical protein